MHFLTIMMVKTVYFPFCLKNRQHITAYFKLTMLKSFFIFKKRRNIIMNKLSLSLVAIAMLTSAAVADISSKEFGGSASLFYGTNDANDGDFFN